jgi:hypothetical protein
MSLIDQQVQMWNFNALVKIRKYKRLHERHYFISMAMEVHDALGHDMDHQGVCLYFPQ